MIRFCDGYMISVDKNEISRQNLLSAIWKEHLENYVFAVRDGEKWHYITYIDVLTDCNIWDNLSNRDNIIYDKYVFEACNDFFRKNPGHRFVPVVSRDDSVIYLAYQDNRRLDNGRKLIKGFSALYDKEYVSIGEVYKNIKQVDLYEVNELSFAIYKYLKKYNFPYKLYGEQWRLLEEDYEMEMNKCTGVSGQDIMTLYGDIKDTIPPAIDSDCYFARRSVIEQYLILYKLIVNNTIEVIDKVAHSLCEKNIMCILAKVPIPRLLNELSDSEKYSAEHEIAMYGINKIDNGEEYNNLVSIYGEKLCEQFKNGETLNNRVIKLFNEIKIYSLTKDNRKKNIWICGPCIAFQSELMMEDTLVYQIQRMVDKCCPGEYKVSAVIMDSGNIGEWEEFSNIIDIYSQDIFLFIHYSLKECNDAEFVELTDFYNDRAGERYFADIPIHVNQLGSRRLAEYLFSSVLKGRLSSEPALIVSYACELDNAGKESIDRYVSTYKEYIKPGHNGAVVMNCNPFTNGHAALIDEARKHVDYLYVFVVEEDMSYFPFEDRLRLVREGVSGYDNVIVLPSGNMMISRETFAAYFTKEIKQDEVIDASLDVRVFGNGIAPAFNIEKRFVGEEPTDNITRQYNEEMKKRLPAYGVELIEIPRKTSGDTIISAGLVRRYLKEGQMDLIRSLVPNSTWEYLCK